MPAKSDCGLCEGESGGLEVGLGINIPRWSGQAQFAEDTESTEGEIDD